MLLSLLMFIPVATTVWPYWATKFTSGRLTSCSSKDLNTIRATVFEYAYNTNVQNMLKYFIGISFQRIEAVCHEVHYTFIFMLRYALTLKNPLFENIKCIIVSLNKQLMGCYNS